MFESKDKKKNEYPCKPQFYYIKVGCKGVFITRIVIMMRWRRFNFNSELLPIKLSDFTFNLSKVNLDDACYVIVTYVDVFFLKKIGLMKW